MKKVKLDSEATGFDLSSPLWAEDYLWCILEREAPSLKEELKESPWTLNELRRYAEKNPRFAELLHEAERTDWVTPLPSIVGQLSSWNI